MCCVDCGLQDYIQRNLEIYNWAEYTRLTDILSAQRFPVFFYFYTNTYFVLSFAWSLCDMRVHSPFTVMEVTQLNNASEWLY